MTMRARLVVFLTVSVLAHGAQGVTSVLAAKGNSSAEAVTDQARALHKQGAKHFQAGDNEKAYAAFSAAFSIKPYYQIAGSLGAVELKLGRYRDAARHLSFFLAELKDGGKSAEREATELLLAEALSKVGVLRITVEPAGAVVKLNNQPLTADRYGPLFVEPGEHIVEASKPGMRTLRVNFRVVAGASESIALKLETMGVELDADLRGATPYVLGFGLGLGTLAAGLASGFTVAANNQASDAEQLRTLLGGDSSACAGASPPAQCAELVELVDGERTLTAAALGTWIGAGALWLGSGIYGIIALNSQSAEEVEVLPSRTMRWTVIPMMAGEGAGAAVIGRF